MKKYQKLFIKLSLIMLPIIILLVSYIILDPFKVVRQYDKFYENGKFPVLELNRDYVSFVTHENQYRKLKYDSYIFGNSKSRAFKAKDWSGMIQNSIIYHFDSNLESIYGILKKLEYLDKNEIKIKNSILVIDDGVLLGNSKNFYKGHLFNKYHAYTDVTFFEFHYDFIRSFCTYDVFVPYLKFKLLGDSSNLKKSLIFQTNPEYVIQNSNEYNFEYLENKIKNDSVNYYRDLVWSKLKINKEYPVSINNESFNILVKINKLLKKNNTNFKIIISPSSNSYKLNKKDLILLKSVFGIKNVFDFSGINQFSKNKGNFYEHTHYRYHVANEILNIIYN